jgi:hypothetical protein
MKPTVIVGVIIALLGLLALAMPEFTTNETKNVVTFGDLKVQATEPTSHSVPPTRRWSGNHHRPGAGRKRPVPEIMTV